MKPMHQLITTIWLAFLLVSVSAISALTDHSLPFSAFAQQPAVAVVNAASYASDFIVAPNSIAAAFGSFKTQNDQVYSATSRPLPTSLGGVKVTVNGVDAGLFFVSNTQINFLIPASTPIGSVSVTVTNSDNTTRSGTVTIAQTAAGIFTARANGQGVAAAVTTTDGVSFKAVGNPDGTELDVDPGTSTRPTYLVLFATGVRNAPAANPNDGNGVAEAVTVTIQGVPATVTYAGRQPDFDGLDQINVVIPPQLAGLGSVKVKLIIDGKTANVVTIKIAGTPPPINVLSIEPGQTISGALTADDQVQDAGNGSGNSFFFDAYIFRATSNLTIAVDLRSSQFDAAIIIYRVNSDNTLSFFAADDQLGGMGDGKSENNNALLLTVLPDNSEYVIFATSADMDPNGMGNYTLKLLTNVIQPVSYGTTISNASIATTDLQTSAGDYLDAYWFSGVQGDTVRITMSSTDFDSFLILNNRNGDLLTFDDNSGGGVNAQITRQLPESGVFIVIATPFAPNKTGNYSFSLTKQSGGSGSGDTAQSFAPGREWREERGAQGSNSDRYALRRVVVPR